MRRKCSEMNIKAVTEKVTEKVAYDLAYVCANVIIGVLPESTLSVYKGDV